MISVDCWCHHSYCLDLIDSSLGVSMETKEHACMYRTLTRSVPLEPPNNCCNSAGRPSWPDMFCTMDWNDASLALLSPKNSWRLKFKWLDCFWSSPSAMVVDRLGKRESGKLKNTQLHCGATTTPFGNSIPPPLQACIVIHCSLDSCVSHRLLIKHSSYKMYYAATAAKI